MVIDYRMPEFDSKAFIERLRNEHPAIKVILVSGKPELSQLAATLGVRYFLRKPFDMDQLLDLAATALGVAVVAGAPSVGASAASIRD